MILFTKLIVSHSVIRQHPNALITTFSTTFEPVLILRCGCRVQSGQNTYLCGIFSWINRKISHGAIYCEYFAFKMFISWFLLNHWRIMIIVCEGALSWRKNHVCFAIYYLLDHVNDATGLNKIFSKRLD